MSNTSLATMKDLQVRVAETVQASFGMLIPDAAFKELVDKAVTEFFETPVNFDIGEKYISDGRGYFNDTKVQHLSKKMTAFEILVYTEIMKTTQTMLKEHLKEHEDKLKEKMQEVLASASTQDVLKNGMVTMTGQIQQYQTLIGMQQMLGMLQANMDNAFRNIGTVIPR